MKGITTFRRIPEWLLCKVDGNAIKTYAALQHFDLPKGCYPSIARIAQTFNMNERTVQRGLEALQDAWAIKIERVAGRSSRYKIFFVRPTSDPDPDRAKNREATTPKFVGG